MLLIRAVRRASTTPTARRTARSWPAPFRSLALTGARRGASGSSSAALLPDTAILTLTNVPVEPIALVVADPARPTSALQSSASRDAAAVRRRASSWRPSAGSSILYPNITALPLPSAVVAAYQGILPTYLYAFQFPVSTVDRSVTDAAADADVRAS